MSEVAGQDCLSPPGGVLIYLGSGGPTGSILGRGRRGEWAGWANICRCQVHGVFGRRLNKAGVEVSVGRGGVLGWVVTR